jgi:two-component system chemotaxis response regulator CheY
MYFSDMTAIELLLQIRNEPLSQETNFMLISSETSFAKIDPIKQAGVLAVLPKPFDRRDFRTALNAARDTLEVSHLTLENLDLDNLRGLIVDDSKTARRHIMKLLTSCGIDHCLQAENGHQAIDLLHQEHIDFIITDYNMPEMNGQELAEYLSKSEFSYLPVLMVTSEANNSRLSAVRQAGVCALFDKTIDPASLKNALNNVLND